MHFEMGCYYFWQADILNHHCDYDIVIMFKRKHLNGVLISTYGTVGLGEAFVSGEGEWGPHLRICLRPSVRNMVITLRFIPCHDVSL